MGTATGLTADRMLEIEQNAIVGGTVVDGQLVLVRNNGAEVVAGYVKGDEGAPGVPPMSESEWQDHIENLIQVANDLSSAEATLTDNTTFLINLNDVVLPGIEADLTAATAAVEGMESQVTANSDALNTLNVVTLPALSDALAANSSDLDTLAGKFPVDGPDIQAGAIDVNHLAADSVTANAIAAGAVTANEIAANTITANEIGSDAITTNELAAGAVTAEEIAAGAVIAEKLAAGSISASKLSIGDLTNYIADGYLTDPNFATSGNWTVTNLTRVDPVGAPAYIEWTANAGSNTHRKNNNYFEVKPGDQFYFEGEIQAPIENTSNVLLVAAIETYDSDGAMLAWPQLSGQTLTPGAGWLIYSGTITIPAGNSVRARFDAFSNGTTAGQKVRMRKMTLRKKNSGLLIVDGAIQTNHMTANTINGDRIAANTLNADKIVAGTITASRLSVGNLGENAVPNGSFEDSMDSWTNAAPTVGTVDTVTGIANSTGARVMRLIRTSAATGNGVNGSMDNNRAIPVAPGEAWTVSARAKSASAITGFYFRATWLDSNRAVLSGQYTDVASNVALTTDWQTFTDQVTPPSAARYMRLELIGWDTTKDVTFYVDAVTARKLILSTMIGDGEIKTEHMIADTIMGDVIKANTLDADRITAESITSREISARAITAEKLTLTDINNYIRNPVFDFADDNGIPLDWPTLIRKAATDPTVPAGSPYPYVGITSDVIPDLQDGDFEVEPGEKYYVEWYSSTLQPIAQVAVGLYLSTADHTVTETVSVTRQILSANSAWVKYEDEIVIPNTNAWARATPFVRQGSAGPWFVTGLKLQKKTSGHLLVDGAIDGMVITGGVIQTAAEGNRIVIQQGTSGGFGTEAGVIEFRPNDAEISPGTLDAYYDPDFDKGEIRLRPPGYNPGEASMSVTKNAVSIIKQLAVSGPIFQQPHRSIRTRDATQNIPNSTWTTLLWTENIDTDAGTSWTYSNGIWTMNALNSLYHVSCSITFPSNTTGRRALRILGTQGATATTLDIVEVPTATGTISLNISGYFRHLTLASGTLSLEAWQNSGGALAATLRQVVVQRIM